MLTDEALENLRVTAGRPLAGCVKIGRDELRALLAMIDAASGAASEKQGKGKPPPVSAAREAAIRAEYGDGGRFYKREVSELLRALDHERARADECEAWCARLAHDRSMETGLRAIERALVVGFVNEAITEDGPDQRDAHGDLKRLRNRLLAPDPLIAVPPHEKTLTRLRHLESALAEILAYEAVGASECHAELARVRRIARAALGEGGS